MHLCRAMASEVRRGHGIPLELELAQCLAALWVLGLEPWFSERAANTLKLLSHLLSWFCFFFDTRLHVAQSSLKFHM